MASASTIPPSHVGTCDFQPDTGEPDEMQFPELNSSKSERTDNEWEMVPPQSPSQVKFDIPEQEPAQVRNPKCLLHSQSSPNLTEYVIEESETEEEEEEKEDSFEAVAHAHDDSSSFTLVSGPPSVNSIWSSRISFKDALLQKSNTEQQQQQTSEQQQPSKQQHHHHHHQRIRKVKPKFVVTQVVPIKHAHSTGDLQSMIHHADDDEILGDTDAHEYYSRKAQGSLGRKNGQKIRPDEAKRLQMTLNKKNLQRARQSGR